MKSNRTRTSLTAFVVCLAAAVWLPSVDEHARAEQPQDSATPWKIPASLKAEHEELHAQLLAATRAGGQTEVAAKEVARLLHAHFQKEEEYALPPLGLLQQLAEGKVTPEMQKVIGQTEKLRAELPQMLREHEAVVAALEDLANAAKTERKPEYARFAEKLKSHAQTEEEILYPTAILIGEYLKLRFQEK